MRILILNWRDIKNPAAGGAEVYTHEIARRLVKRGNKVTLFTSTFKGCKSDEFVDGVRIVRAGNRYSVYWKAYEYYKKFFKGEFDLVVDAINTIPFFTPLYVKDKKLAVIFQMTGDVYFTVLPKPFALLASRAEPTLFKIYRKIPIIVLSESIKGELTKIGFPPCNISVVSPGIDHKKFGVGSKTNFPTVLYLNRVVRYKNVDDLIKAFGLVKEYVKDAKLLIAGCRGGGYELELRKLVKKLDLSKDVKFYQFVIGDEKKKLLQSSWVHVLPSTKEGWGISTTESAACGTPSIGYDVPGVRDSIVDGKTGFIVKENRNIKKLSKAIIKVLESDKLRENLSMNALQRSKKFSWDKTAEEFLRVIGSVVHG